ncbi:AtpZ/AtpI family protein [Winogradskyella echinorum]|uniref:AtpZ/AtpI family protein n=1 Tax=Winogradskyella echinorum TaxID=538189 RepID=A0ABR6XYY4_9FLAO|nr:AtpZ/AtpI family protein [Winogradskyella echinorum]MBC3845713.1 AtpZ/AtpI family protein [Winogradskyella echinorum]MBC5750061.1 AtpZ/AtpI family protein [Winogradskyella echinorum]
MSQPNHKQPNQSNKQLNDRKDKLKSASYARFSGIAFQMIAIIGIGSYSGVKLDELYPNKHNVYTIVLSLLSVIISIVFVIRRIIAGSKDN